MATLQRGFILPLLAPLVSALVWEDGTGKLPAMGWNSWNTYECNIKATLFTDQAQAMLDLGLLVGCAPLFGLSVGYKQRK